jgi:flagellar assembly protein FliH
MTSSFSRPAEGQPTTARIPVKPVSSFQYRELPALPRVMSPAHGAGNKESDPEPTPRAEVELTRAELEAALAAARAEGRKHAEAHLAAEMRARSDAEAAKLVDALAAFSTQQREYFARVEGEVVRLALSVAGKILHREAQVDPLLVATLVQIALNQLRENTAVTVRVHPDEAERWRAHFSARPQTAAVTVVGDGELDRGGCLLETELGQANFSLAAQLKEVEQGFFDLLSQTPRP